MTTTEAALRVMYADGVPYLALTDVAAFLLDAAADLDSHDVPASDALRSIAAGLANYERKTR